MASSPVASTWGSAVVPGGIRQPWQVFSEHLEELLEHAGDDGGTVVYDDPLFRFTLMRSEFFPEYLRNLEVQVQTEGALKVFVGLPQMAQQEFAEVSLMELAAYASWRRAVLKRFPALEDGDLQKHWESLSLDAKADFVPDDSTEALASQPDGRWMLLLCDGPPPCVAPCPAHPSLLADMSEDKPRRHRWVAGLLREKRPRWAAGVLSAQWCGGVEETASKRRRLRSLKKQ